MKFPRTLSLIPLVLAPAIGQTDRPDLAADKLVRDDALVRGLGHARAKLGDLVLQADEATWHNDTGELEMRGHVHVTLPAREDHTVVRYQIDILLTDQPIGLTADRAAVKGGLLEASGNIVLVPVDPELPKAEIRGDELSMKLKVGDATLRGNVRRSGFPEPDNSPPFSFHLRPFPPEIIR